MYLMDNQLTEHVTTLTASINFVNWKAIKSTNNSVSKKMNYLKKKGLETSKETRIGLNELLPNTHSILDIQIEREKN